MGGVGLGGVVGLRIAAGMPLPQGGSTRWMDLLWERHSCRDVPDSERRSNMSARHKPRSKDLSKGRCSLAGQIYLVTSVTHDR